MAVMLMQRGAPSDYSDAGELFSQLAKSKAKLREDFRENAIELGLQVSAKEKQFDACHKLLNEIPAGKGIRMLISRRLPQGSICWKDKMTKLQSGRMTRLRSRNDATTVFEIRRLALLLFELKRFAEALPLWQADCRSRHAYRFRYKACLLECANRLEKHDIMLSIFEKLRQAGVVNKALFDAELSLLIEYDIEKAIRNS